MMNALNHAGFDIGSAMKAAVQGMIARRKEWRRKEARRYLAEPVLLLYALRSATQHDSYDIDEHLRILSARRYRLKAMCTAAKVKNRPELSRGSELVGVNDLLRFGRYVRRYGNGVHNA